MNQKSSININYIIIIVASILLIFMSIIVFLITKHHYSGKVEKVEVTKEVEKVIEKEVEISGETIQSSLENIGELSTAEYNFTHVEEVSSNKQYEGFDIPFTESSFVYSYDGRIKAGIDFTQIKVDKDDKRKKITVTLPPVKILSAEVDDKSFKLYDQKNNIFNPIEVTDVTDSLASLKETEVEKAIDDGLIKQAENNGRLMIENFMLGSYNINDYDIDVEFEEEEKN